MSRTIITISDSSKESVTEKKEFSKERVEKDFDFMALVDQYQKTYVTIDEIDAFDD